MHAGSAAAWGASSYHHYVPSGHPLPSPYHNGSRTDVALLVEAFSQLGGNVAVALMAMLCVAIPLYLMAVEVRALARNERPGTAFLAVLRDASALLVGPLVNGHDLRTDQPASSLFSASLQNNSCEAVESHKAVPDPARWLAGARRRQRRLASQGVDHGVRHMGVIMDGNRRYGKEMLGSSLRGHEAGGDALMRFIVWCADRDIDMLTVYAFSTENWNRSAVEIAVLMRLFREFFEKIRREARDNGIRIRYLVSDESRLPRDIVELMRQVEEETKHYRRIVVNVCVSYGGRASIVGAAQRLHAAGVVPTDDLLRRELTRSLCDARPVPITRDASLIQMESGRSFDLAHDPDVLLRTSLEQRVSNFMLYESAYTEMFFENALWPAISEACLDRVLDNFHHGRQRRFGK